MSTDHRKPAVAFVALALAAAALVGIQQADAQGGRFMAGIVGIDAHARGEIAAASRELSPHQTPLGQAFVAFSRPHVQSKGPSRTGGEDDEVSRSQDRPPAPGAETRVKGVQSSTSSSDSAERNGGTAREEGSSRSARAGNHEPGRRGADRRWNRAAEHAAAHEETGSRRGRTGDQDR
jgi:hypothetical protein